MSFGNSVDKQAETVFTTDMAHHHPTTDREVAMSQFLVSCPCGCGQAVTAHDAGFSATTCKVDCCEASLLVSVTVRKSWAYANAVPVTGLRHQDGLVVFS